MGGEFEVSYPLEGGVRRGYRPHLACWPDGSYKNLWSPAFRHACRGSRSALWRRVALIRVPRAARAVPLAPWRHFRLSHTYQRLIRCRLLTSGNAGYDSRQNERSIGTWPMLCYVAICEDGPTWTQIAYAENPIANLSASCPQPIRIPASPTSQSPSDTPNSV